MPTLIWNTSNKDKSPLAEMDNVLSNLSWCSEKEARMSHRNHFAGDIIWSHSQGTSGDGDKQYKFMNIFKKYIF